MNPTAGKVMRGPRRRTALAVLAAASGAMFWAARTAAADTVRRVPPPAIDAVTAAGAGTDVAVLAGGCFWGVQGVFQHVQGVTSVVSGYAGGDPSTARYEAVSSGATGHAESVRIVFDPRIISTAEGRV